MQKDLISIIMPVKNAGHLLWECLESIEKQTYPNWELTVVNDHSTDNPEAIVSCFQAKGQPIKLIKNAGKGIIPALETALKACNGKFITRMDADDVMPPKRLELMINALYGTSSKTIVTGKVKYFSDLPISEGYLKYENWLNERVDNNDHWEWVYRECVIASPGWMAHRQALLNREEFTDLSYPEDYDLVLKWYRSGFTIKPIPEVTLHWREHAKRISRLSKHYSQESFFQLKLRHFVGNELEKTSELLIWGTNKKGKLTARILTLWNIVFRWMTLYPDDHPKKIYNKKIEDFELSTIEQPFKLLIAVYPDQKDLIKMRSYLEGNNLEMGKDYWFL